MSSDNTSDGLSVLAACTAEVRQWYLQNGLQLNPDKSEALVIGTANQLRTANSAITSVCVADVQLPVADEISARCRAGSPSGVRQTRYGGDPVVQFPCISHMPYTPSIVDRSGTDTDLQSDPDETGLLQLGTLWRASQQHPEVAACAEQCSQNRPPFRLRNDLYCVEWGVKLYSLTQAPRRSHAKPPMRQLQWLPVQHRIDYKVSVLTYKTLNTSVPQYLSQRINRRVNARTLRSSATPLLIQPFARTSFANVLFDVPRCLSGTHFPRLSSKATHCLYSNLG